MDYRHGVLRRFCCFCGNTGAGPHAPDCPTLHSETTVTPPASRQEKRGRERTVEKLKERLAKRGKS